MTWVSPVAGFTEAVPRPLEEATERVSSTVNVLTSHVGTAGGCPDNVQQVGGIVSMSIEAKAAGIYNNCCTANAACFHRYKGGFTIFCAAPASRDGCVCAYAMRTAGDCTHVHKFIFPCGQNE